MFKKATYSLRSVKQRGRIHGRGWRWVFWPFIKRPHPVIPGTDENEPPPFEDELFKMGEKMLSDLEEEWSQRDKALKEQFCATLTKYNLALKRLEEEEEDIEEARKEFDIAEEEWENYRKPQFSATTEWLVVIVLAVAEIFFNYQIFLILGASKKETWIIAASLAIALPVSAMFFGKIFHRSNKSIYDQFILIFLGLVPFVALVAIAILRGAYFEMVFKEAGSSAEDMPVSTLLATIAFFAINLLVWVVGVVVSYLANPENPEEYKLVKERYKTAKKNFEQEGKAHSGAVVAYEKTKEELERWKHKRKEEYDLYVSRARDIQKLTKLYISAYRNANVEVRKDGKIPPCFRTPVPEPDIPAMFQLEDLDWQCYNH